MNPEQNNFIQMRGVNTHNLKALDINFPLNELSVVTGVSGSGKSSLVFDSLYAESYRRYVESLSSFARQYLQAMPRPDLDSVTNLPPAVAVKQTKGGGNARSTVGTATELYDLIRIIFTHLSKIHCFECGEPVQKDNPERVLRKILEKHSDNRIHVLAPLNRFSAMKPKDLMYHLESQGFGRVWNNGEVQKLEECDLKNLLASHVVVDRAKISNDQLSRLTQSVLLAAQIGSGDFSLLVEGEPLKSFSQRLVCCGIQYKRPTLSLFSFNHPRGACETCQGFGYEAAIDWSKVFPDLEGSLSAHSVLPWNFGRHDDMYDLAKPSARRHKIAWSKKFEDYTDSEMEWLKHGAKQDDFPGVTGYFEWLNSKRHKAHYRIHAARFRKYNICSSCDGDRLNKYGRSCHIDDQNISKLTELPLDQLIEWVNQIATSVDNLNINQKTGVVEAVLEMRSRLGYLQQVGLGYLTLSRQTKTLSGGEMQRINMARCLGSALTDTLFCLDEPTAGLHPKDSAKLLTIIRELKRQGNTVVVVEHERTLIEGCDHLVEVGPSAGHKGGNITFSGSVAEYPNEKISWALNDQSKKATTATLQGATVHNLKGDDFVLPCTSGILTVCGVSGSGKTSLIQHCVYPTLATLFNPKNALREPDDKIGAWKAETPLRYFDSIMLVSQEGIGRSSRSNIVTYLGIYDAIRKLLAREPRAEAAQLTPSSFSFNSVGGRCEQCRGLGVVKEDLSFLGEMNTICSDCNGRRFIDEVLEVKFRGNSLDKILEMTVDEARTLFCDSKEIVKGLDVAIKLGLGYLTLGQSTNSFSGGEAQRLKLVKLLYNVNDNQKRILIFDEPTTGLSDFDVENLIKQLRLLVEKGHLVIAIEHHIGLISTSDWVCELGPEASHNGGQILYQGAPHGLLKVKNSATAKFLQCQS